jgi:SpoVK/Ycf46/Vps4 family AAA+-type ATPase
MSSMKQWAQVGEGFMPCGETQQTLKPGFYKPSTTGGMFPQMVINPVTPVTDNLLVLADSPVASVVDSIQKFWKAEERYKRSSVIHKRGILMEGPPGTGKTSIANLIAKFVVENGGVTFFGGADSIYMLRSAMTAFRKIQAEPLLIIIEEFDLLNDDEDSVDTVMQMMDGIDQINNIVFLCTTNYVERIDDRFTKRPSRIDEIIHVGLPTKIARKAYLEELLIHFGGSLSEVAEFVTATDGLLISHLKEAVIATKILERPLQETVTRLRAMVPPITEVDRQQTAAKRKQVARLNSNPYLTATSSYR